MSFTSVTPSELLRGVLPVVISGGRPRLAERKTARLLPALCGVTADPVWLVREDRALEYERDGFEVATFPRDEALSYARDHWMGPRAFSPTAFMGCFLEREWACRVARARGFWGVLQLDDNIRRLCVLGPFGACAKVARVNGGLALHADLLAAVTRSTNSAMTGARLEAVMTTSEGLTFARAGFPYSLFLERVDVDDREPYYGYVEEDILHAYQIGANASRYTSSLVYPLTYLKQHTALQSSGMRVFYRSNARAAGLQRMAPEMARMIISGAHSNGQGGPRVFHKMLAGSIRTPLVIDDPQLYGAARDRVMELLVQVEREHRSGLEESLGRRAARAAGWPITVRGRDG